MKRDADKVVDARHETQVDWDREVKEGNLTRVTPLARSTSDPTFRHVQGCAVSDEEERARVRPAEVMQHVALTGRYPTVTSKSFIDRKSVV